MEEKSEAGGHILLPRAESVKRSAFRGRDITGVTLPEGYRRIGAYAFCECGALRSVILPAGLRAVGDFAFRKCGSLEHIELPESVEALGKYAFSGCERLAFVRIPQDAAVGIFAFMNCVGLSEVVCGAREIGDNAFRSCKKLSRVVLGRSLCSIGGRAFWGCEQLTSLGYCGTVAEWKSIALGDAWAEGSLIGEIVCTDGAVRL